MKSRSYFVTTERKTFSFPSEKCQLHHNYIECFYVKKRLVQDNSLTYSGCKMYEEPHITEYCG